MATPPPPNSPATTTTSPSTATQPAKAPAKPFSWLDQWYPVAWAADVPDLKLIPFTIWQRNYVLFRDRATGLFVAMDDVCPHRAAPLSEGRLYERDTTPGKKETVLECGYHGWRFNCHGRCVDIPVVPLERRIPAAADVAGVYATAESCAGLVFVWLGDRANADESKIPMPKEMVHLDSQQRLTFYRNVRRKFPVGYTTILENAVDPAHVQWAHHGSGQGNRNWVPRNGNIEIIETVPEEGYFLSGIRIGDAPGHRLIMTLQAPTSVSYKIVSSAIGSYFLCVWTVPIDHHSSMFFLVNAKEDMAPWPKLMQRLTPRWIEHTRFNMVPDGDNVMLQWQESHLQSRQRDGYGGAWRKQYLFASGTWDALVVEYRRWLDGLVDSMPYVTRMPADAPVELLSRRQLNDRFLFHVQDCASCAPALRNMRMGRVAALVGAGVGAAATLLSGVVYAALAGGGVAFAARPLQVGGGVGLVGCVALLALGRVLSYFIELLTYTEVAYRANHSE